MGFFLPRNSPVSAVRLGAGGMPPGGTLRVQGGSGMLTVLHTPSGSGLGSAWPENSLQSCASPPSLRFLLPGVIPQVSQCSISVTALMHPQTSSSASLLLAGAQHPLTWHVPGSVPLLPAFWGGNSISKPGSCREARLYISAWASAHTHPGLAVPVPSQAGVWELFLRQLIWGSGRRRGSYRVSAT